MFHQGCDHFHFLCGKHIVMVQYRSLFMNGSNTARHSSTSTFLHFVRKTNQREFTLRLGVMYSNGMGGSAVQRISFSSKCYEFEVLRVDENILRLLNQQRQFPFIALNISHIHTVLLSIDGTSVELHG